MKSIERGIFQGPLYSKSDDVGPVKRRRPDARLPSRPLQFPPRPAGVRPLSLAIEDSSSSLYNHTGHDTAEVRRVRPVGLWLNHRPTPRCNPGGRTCSISALPLMTRTGMRMYGVKVPFPGRSSIGLRKARSFTPTSKRAAGGRSKPQEEKSATCMYLESGSCDDCLPPDGR